MGFLINPYSFGAVLAVSYSEDFSVDTWTLEAGTLVAVSSGKMRNNYGGNAADHRRSEALGLTLSNTAWYCEFDWRHVTTGSGLLAGHVYFSDTNTKPLGTLDRISMICQNGDTVAVESKDSTTVVTGASIAVTSSTQYYMTLVRTSSTTAELKVFSDSARTTQVGSTSSVTFSGIAGLDIVQASSTDNGGTTDGNVWYLDNINVWNGVTSHP